MNLWNLIILSPTDNRGPNFTMHSLEPTIFSQNTAI